MRLVWRFSWRILLLALIALTLLQFWFFASIWYWSVNNPDSTAFMRSRLSVLREEQPNARLQYAFVPYQRISPHLKRAVIASVVVGRMLRRGMDEAQARSAAPEGAPAAK